MSDIHNKEHDIVWLDGYLKGLLAFNVKNSHLNYCALSAHLSTDKVSNSFMAFINDDEESQSIDICATPLLLSESVVLEDWDKTISKNIERLLHNSQFDLSRVTGEIFDMVDGILDARDGSAIVLSAKAEMGLSHGEYIFFHLVDSEYFVLSFMDSAL